MSNTLPGCPICGETLNLSIARGRKSGKPFIMLRCLSDGRHFRGFITHRPFVENMLTKLEVIQQSQNGENPVE